MLMCSWNHGGDPADFLLINDLVRRFERDLEDDPTFLQDKVKVWFKDNPHKVYLTMNPDDKFETERQQAEMTLLKDKVAGCDPDLVYKQGLELLRNQEQKEDLGCLPTLTVSDIPRTVAPVVIEHVQSNNVPIQLCAQPTNGLTYFRAVTNMADLAEELRPYVPLFCDVITKMGAGDMDYRELSHQVELRTGGLSVGTHLCAHPAEPGQYEQGLLFSSFCLDRNLEAMFGLWSRIFTQVEFNDTERLGVLVRMSAAELANGLVQSGHMYAMGHSASALSRVDQLSETMSGMTQVALMKQVAESRDLTPVVERLQMIADDLLNANHMRCSLNATEESLQEALLATAGFLEQLRGDKDYEGRYSSGEDFTPAPCLSQFELPYQVNFAGLSVRTVPYTHEDFARLRVLAKLLTSRYIHREIREKGGAYGGGATANSSGLFQFFSYRDPNVMRTLETFDRAVDWAITGDYTLEEIDESKLAVFQTVDSPSMETPGNQGQRLFVNGISDELRQRHRVELMEVRKSDLVKVAERYLVADRRLAGTTLLGPENSEVRDAGTWVVHGQ